MTTHYGPAYLKREAIRREQRRRGVVAVPPAALLDRIVAEHEAAARVGRFGHDELCEYPRANLTTFAIAFCYCADRGAALARIARRLDAATDNPLTSNQSVTTTKEGQ